MGQAGSDRVDSYLVDASGSSVWGPSGAGGRAGSGGFGHKVSIGAGVVVQAEKVQVSKASLAGAVVSGRGTSGLESLDSSVPATDGVRLVVRAPGGPGCGEMAGKDSGRLLGVAGSPSEAWDAVGLNNLCLLWSGGGG